MTYVPGDILLRVDTRATAETQHTKHHVMLVTGESEQGFPIVMHMKASTTWALVKEELTKTRELILIHYSSLTNDTRTELVNTAEDALNSENFVINEAIIETHRQAVAPFRPTCSLDAREKLNELHNAFEAHILTFTPIPQKQQIMSCHEWVLAVIHYACRKKNNPIPKSLQIPPHLAWADRIHYAVTHDATAQHSCIEIAATHVRSPQTIALPQQKAAGSTQTFFAPSPSSRKKENQSLMPCCIL